MRSADTIQSDDRAGHAPTARRAAQADAGGAAPEGAKQALEIESWPSLVQSVRLRGAVRSLADNCEMASAAGGRVELVLARDKANFNTDQLRQRLEEALTAHLGGRISLRIVVGDPPRATPAEVRRASEDEQMRRTREAIEKDPNIQAVQAAFDAVLEPDSIKSAGSGN